MRVAAECAVDCGDLREDARSERVSSWEDGVMPELEELLPGRGDFLLRRRELSLMRIRGARSCGCVGEEESVEFEAAVRERVCRAGLSSRSELEVLLVSLFKEGDLRLRRCSGVCCC